MKKFNFRYFACAIIPLVFVACFTKSNMHKDLVSDLSVHNQYVKSGTIEIGFNLPINFNANKSLVNEPTNFAFLGQENFQENVISEAFTCEMGSPIAVQNRIYKRNSSVNFAPLVGFFPLSLQFKPADNEIWIKIVKEKNQIEVYKGEEVLKVIYTEGNIVLAPGEYPLQHKQRNPLWYAPDEYFSRRELRVPPKGDHFRYRRGALGNYALYPTMDFVIHSGPFWSEEVGGLKVSETDLASIFVMLNVGTPIIVK